MAKIFEIPKDRIDVLDSAADMSQSVYKFKAGIGINVLKIALGKACRHSIQIQKNGIRDMEIIANEIESYSDHMESPQAEIKVFKTPEEKIDEEESLKQEMIEEEQRIDDWANTPD